MDDICNGDINMAHRTGNILHGPKHNFKLDAGLGWFIWNSCDKFYDQICQIYAETGETETYSSLKKRATTLATHMRHLGIKKGDLILTCTPNTLDSAVPTTSALFLGVISSSLDPTLSAKECTHLVSLVKPKIIFTAERSIKLIEETLDAVADCKPLIVVFGNSVGYRSFDEFMVKTGEEDVFKPEVLDDDDSSFVVFSSGTSGLPKGICFSQKSIYIGSLACLPAYKKAKTTMNFTSFYWVSAIMFYISQFVNGASRVLVNEFEDEKTLEYIAKYKVNAIIMSSLYAYKITNIANIARFDLSSLTSVILGGCALGPEQLTRVRNLLPQTYSLLGFGMTELCGPGLLFPENERKLAYENPKSCGKPCAGFTIKFVDRETEQQLGPNQSGEMRIKCDSIMLGYYNQDCSSEFDGEGFLKTGDLGHFDENCCVYIYDRIKEMFKYQSWHIVPASLESVVLEHPSVAEAVVVGVPDEEDGHLPAAAVKLHPGSKVTADDVAKFVAERVSDRQRLRGGVFMVECIPKTPTHKVLRRKVLEIVMQHLNNGM